MYKDKLDFRKQYVSSLREHQMESVTKIVDSFFNDFDIRGKCLEIGPGPDSFFHSLVPDRLTDLKRSWVELDLDGQIILAAKQSTRDLGYVVECIQGDAHHIPFADESLDAVCGYSCFHSLLDLQKTVEEAKRVLKPGGIFFSLTDSGDYLTICYDLSEKGCMVFPVVVKYSSESGQPVGFIKNLIAFPMEVLDDSAKDGIFNAFKHLRGNLGNSKNYPWAGEILDHQLGPHQHEIIAKYGITNIDPLRYFNNKLLAELRNSNYQDIYSEHKRAGFMAGLFKYDNPITRLIAMYYPSSLRKQFADVDVVVARKG